MTLAANARRRPLSPRPPAVVNATGGRTFAPPLSQFEPTAPCEKAAAADYYNAVAAAPCIQIPHLENWKCASRAPPASMSVENTSGLIAFIFLLMIGGYSYHGYYFHKGMKLTHPKKSHKYAEYW